MSNKNSDITLQGRNINKMTDNEIIEYLGITDNQDKNYIYNLLIQAREIEKIYNNQDVDYCLKEDYYSYMLDVNTTIINKTQDIIIYKYK
nr:MAG TPA: hypothetical protein [Caudoviricetes sp.]